MESLKQDRDRTCVDCGYDKLLWHLPPVRSHEITRNAGTSKIKSPPSIDACYALLGINLDTAQNPPPESRPSTILSVDTLNVVLPSVMMFISQITGSCPR